MAHKHDLVLFYFVYVLALFRGKSGLRIVRDAGGWTGSHAVLIVLRSK